MTRGGRYGCTAGLHVVSARTSCYTTPLPMAALPPQPVAMHSASYTQRQRTPSVVNGTHSYRRLIDRPPVTYTHLFKSNPTRTSEIPKSALCAKILDGVLDLRSDMMIQRFILCNVTFYLLLVCILLGFSNF